MRVLLSALLLLTGCVRSQPSFEPRIDQVDLAVMAKEAAIIVNGIPVEINAVGHCGTFRIIGEKWPLIKKRVRLLIENVLKGTVATGELAFYRYEWCGNYIRNGTPEWDPIQQTTRAVFFLQPVQGGFRAFTDHTHTHVEIFTGYHSTEEIQGETVPDRLFWLMTTPGPDTDAELFAATLRLQLFEAASLVGQSRVYQHLLRLLEDRSTPEYQPAACIAIGWWFPGRASCFEQPYMSPVPAALSTDIQAGRRAAVEREQHIQNIFLTDPWKWVRVRGAESCGALEILSLHEDPKVARLARSLLLSEINEYSREGCPTIDPFVR